ncbi:hypothetical protein P6166_00760 [Stenotrophomonas sp. HITSZ_GD]|uniref:hypothetical protein n=1 Tax=Stenotrophomonas sp. HITSZ_GD TaxID=3037248 RepID=UPI00240E4372|nr:hypothetical protein [Stenotrophomonas sp. HITSZ_GD]MDG2523892.1 hypothetical protein [Stenotrophomonas sp. HITSZ_GD]
MVTSATRWTVMMVLASLASACTNQTGPAVSIPAARAPEQIAAARPAASQGHLPTGMTVRSVGAKAYVVETFSASPPGSALHVVTSLAGKAKAGDAEAAYAIYLKIRDCSEQALMRPAAAPDSNCEGLDVDDGAAAYQWLELAAHRGSLQARLLYASDPEIVLGDAADMLRDPERILQYKTQAMRYLNEAAQGGSVDALLALADLYRGGTVVNRDLPMSYAYLQAAARADPALVPQVRMDELALEIGPQERARALQASGRIYEQCCVD